MRCTERCPNCPSRETDEKPMVSGDYQQPNPQQILFVGEAPNQEGSNRRRVMAGKWAEEFSNTYLPLAGLQRESVWITNAVKCHWTGKDDSPPAELVKSCSEFHLRRELAKYKPRYVVLMGATANSLMDWDVEMEHGMVHHGSLLGWNGTLFSTIHPAFGLHKSDKMLAMVDKLDGDFPRLQSVLRGNLQPVYDNLATKFVRLRDARKVRTVLRHGLARFSSIAVDTESKKTWRGYASTERYIPWCATFAIEPGEAFMVRTDDEDAFREFLELLLRYWRPIFHNMPYDFGILEMVANTLGVRWLDSLWRNSYDTMQMAYDDGRVPKGLKGLGYRLLGKRMTSFDDTVVPHSRYVAIEYLQQAMMRKWTAREQEWTGDMVTKNCPDCKGTGKISNGCKGKLRKLYPCDCNDGKVTVRKMTRKQGLTEKLNRLASDMTKGTDIDLWQRWIDWTEADPIGMKEIIDTMGPMPLPSIEYVPEGQAIEYACGDAHETLRIFPILQKRLVDLRRSITG